MLSSPQKQQITLLAESEQEAKEKAACLQDIGQFIDLDNLKTLAKAAKKPGMNQRIKQFKAFL